MVTQIDGEDKCRMAARFYSIIRCCCCHMISSWFFRNNPPPSFLEIKPYLYDTYLWPCTTVLVSYRGILHSTWGSQTKSSLSVLVPKNTKIWYSGYYAHKQARVNVFSQTVRGVLHVGSEPTWAPGLYSVFRKEDPSKQLRSVES